MSDPGRCKATSRGPKWRSDRPQLAPSCSTRRSPSLVWRSFCARGHYRVPQAGRYPCDTHLFSCFNFLLDGEILQEDPSFVSGGRQVSFAVVSGDARHLHNDGCILFRHLLSAKVGLLSELVLLEGGKIDGHETIKDLVDALPIVRVHSFERTDRVGERFRDALGH